MRNLYYNPPEIQKENIPEERMVYKTVKSIFSMVKTLEYQMNTVEGLLESILNEIKKAKEK